MKKYEMIWIEWHNPDNRLNEDENEKLSYGDEKLRKVGIQRIIKEYEDTGRKAKHTSDATDDEWAEFEITFEFEAKNIVEAKQIALDIYDGTNDVFSVFDEHGKRIFTEEDYMWEAKNNKVNRDTVGSIIENFIIYFTTNEKERTELYDSLEVYLKEGEPFC